MDEKSKIKSYPLKIDEKSLDELKELAPAYGHSTLASFIRWILINFKNKHKDYSISIDSSRVQTINFTNETPIFDPFKK